MTEEVKTVPNIYQKILCVMEDLDYIQKGDAKVNGQYRFVSHDQVTAKIHPLLVKHRIVIIPTVQETTQENNRTVVKLAMVFVNADNPQDNFTSVYTGYGVDAGDKGPGKAISYAYKYGCLKTFCLETGDDPDMDAKAVYEPKKCLEFDGMIPDEFNDKERAKLIKFLAYCAECTGKHVEEIKQEAVKRAPEFFASFKKWNPNKKAES